MDRRFPFFVSGAIGNNIVMFHEFLDNVLIPITYFRFFAISKSGLVVYAVENKKPLQQ